MCCLLLWGGASLSAPSETYVSVDELTATLKTRNIDRILVALNAVKQMSYQGEILPFVRDLWDGRKDRYPDLPWETINADIVRVDIANILLQAEANGKIKVDKEKIHRYVAGLLGSTDIDVVRNAILTLSLLDDEKDVDKILAIAKQQQKGTFRAAVVALSKMCNPAAAKALAQLEESVTQKELRSYVAETRRESQGFKERSGWCDRKP
jgi:hypothetical protein